MICNQCQTRNPHGAKFCTECGSALKPRCPQCRTELPASARFCHECGTRVAESGTPPRSATSSAPQSPESARGSTQPPRPKKTTGEVADDPKSGPANPPPEVPGLAERRQTTVIFSDLASSTSLSQRLDPEDLNTVVHAYYAVCRAVCQRYGGHIANYLGDGVLIMFGYPKAHEDDAHRAVRTGLGILEGMASLNTRLEREMNLNLQVRVGIHTGLMVVGDDRAGDWQKMALGETLNVASRVQSVAALDTVVISSVTQQLVHGFFACRSIGFHSLRGVAQPMEIFCVTAESTARGRLEAAGRSTLTPLTGRDQEVELLMREWELSAGGDGHAILITGEGGIGKSRLVQMMKEHVANVPDAWLTPCQCSPYHQNTSMYPFIDLIERVVLKIHRQDSPRERLNKLEGMIVQYGLDPRESLPVFAAYHSLPPEAGYEPSPMDPAQQRRHYMDSMRRILNDRSVKQPLLFVVEDLHWADPTTLETLRELVQTIPNHRMLALFTARPEFLALWGDPPNTRILSLERLDAPQTRTICLRVARGKRLPEEVVEQIIERADGVPLFAEELTKMIIGSGLLEEGTDSFRLNGPLPPLAIPSTLRDSLMARLDRLSAVKEVAQIAAVIGREFTYELVRYVYPFEDAFLRHSLRQLLDEEIIDQPWGPDSGRYAFQHMLVQEAAYESLVRSRRQHYHRLIAHALEEHFPEVVAAEPEILAHHYTEANLGWQAIPYHQKAGARAASQSSHNEAIVHFERALELVRPLAENAQRGQLEITTLLGLGASLSATRGYGAIEVEQTYVRARDLCEQFGLPGQLFQSRYGLWRLHMLRAEYDTATRKGLDLLDLAQRQQNDAFLIAANRALGATLFYRARYPASVEHVTQVIEKTTSQAGDDRLIRDIYDVVDPRVTCRSYLSWNLWMLGRPDQARHESASAIALAEQLQHPFSIALALSFAAWLEQFCGNVPRVRELATRAMTLCQDRGFPFWIGWNQVLLGWAAAQTPAPDADPVALIHQGLAYWKEKGSNLGRGYFLCLLAETHIRREEWSQCMDALSQAQAFIDETDERYWEPERLRLAGESLLRQGNPPDQAASCFHQALEKAQSQSSHALALRAATSLVRMELGLATPPVSRKVLQDILAHFTEGADTPDLRSARQILAAPAPAAGS